MAKKKLQFDRDKLMGVLKSAKEKEETSGFVQDIRIWKPSPPVVGKAVTYRIRPIPIITAGGYPEPEVRVFKHMYKSEITGQFVSAICPKTKESKAKCPLCDYGWELWNSGDPEDKKESSKYRNKTQYVTNILVIKDVGEDRQENIGKVFMYQYGKKVHDKFQDAMFPDEDSGESPILFYDPIEGHDFLLKVTKVDEYPNYDSSKFAQDPSQIAKDDDATMEILESAYNITEELLPASEFKSYSELVALVDSTIHGTSTKSATKEVVEETAKKDEEDEEVFNDIVGSSSKDTEDSEEEDDFVASLEAELGL